MGSVEQRKVLHCVVPNSSQCKSVECYLNWDVHNVTLSACYDRNCVHNVCVCACVCACMCLCIYVSIYVYVCMYVCMCLCVYTCGHRCLNVTRKGVL